MQDANRIPFPQHIDSSKPFLIWTADEMVPMVFLLCIGLLLGRIFPFLVAAFVSVVIWRRIRDNTPDGFLLHWLYRWGAPVKGRSFVNPYDEEIRSR